MIKQYKVVNGTHYDVRTPDSVIKVLENARQKRQRLHISLGYTEHDGYDDKIGQDWLEEYMSHGYIGRSTDIKPIPLLVHNSRSMGGPALLDYCIVRIRTSKGGNVLYQHPKYDHGKITVHRKFVPVDYPGGKLTVEVRRNGEEHASFRDMTSARRFLKKLGLKSEIVNVFDAV